MSKRKRKHSKRRRERQNQGDEKTARSPLAADIHSAAEPIAQNEAPTLKPSPKGFSIGVILTGLTLAVACVTAFWEIGQPDIRYIPVLDSDSMTTVESTIDSAGNFIDNVKLRTTYTNFSFKPGYIDKVEFVPQSIETLPNIRVTSIDKTFVYWHQKKVIEVNFLISIPSDPMNHPNTTRDLKVDQVLAVYDNTGKRVQLLPDGRYGRIDLKFNQNVSVKMTYH